MPASNSQMVYGFSGESKPVVIGEGKDSMKLVSHDSFIEAMDKSEMAMIQKITQDNAETVRLNEAITAAAIPTVDPATGGIPELIAQGNAIASFLNTQLVQLGKSNATSSS